MIFTHAHSFGIYWFLNVLFTGNWKIMKIIFYCSSSVFLLLVTLFFCFETYTLFVYHFEGTKDLPLSFGNFPHNREKLTHSKQKDKFSFAVMGDTQSAGTFEEIANKLKDEPLAFTVFLGDFVRKGTEGEHNYFKAEALEFGFSYPVFFVVGNHDVDISNFPISKFEEIYGPSIFSFTYQECLFVFLRILNEPYSNKESLQFLERLIANDASSRHKKKFVFMHIPPPVSSDFTARQFEGADELVQLIEKLNADYVIAGDYHGYARITLGKTVYLITGGGGAHLEKNKFGYFHHALVLNVSKNHVSEKILVVNRNEKFEDSIERFALADVYSWQANNVIEVFLINIILVASIVGLYKYLNRYSQHSKKELTRLKKHTK